MDWNQIRQRWQSASGPQLATPDGELLADLRRREARLRGQVQRRDRLETTVALLLVPIFGYASWRAGLRGDWLPMAFTLWLTAWLLYVPWHFWRVRRRMPPAQPQQALVVHLTQQRDAMLAQARMLEQVWLWYLAPCAIGAIGFNFAVGGATPRNFIYAAVVLAFCVFLDWLNRRAARTHFRDLAAGIDQQLTTLQKEDHP